MIEPMKPPQMRITLPRCSDEEVAELCGWCASLEVRHGIEIPNFARWLAETIAAEIRRRASGGAVEAGSVGLPPMGPNEVGTVLMILTSRTYCPQGERIAKFFDGMLTHVVALAAVQLSEFQTLCEAINEQAESEQ